MIITVAEEILSKIEASPVEPDGNFIYGNGLVNDLGVVLGVNNLTKFPDGGPKFVQVGHRPGMQILIRFYTQSRDQQLKSDPLLLRESP